MTAIVSVVLSYVALSSGVPVAGVSANACTVNGGSCEARAASDEPTIYATPTEVDCRAATGTRDATGRAALLLSGDCDFPPTDFRYRVSRFPDSERPAGSLRPQRARRQTRSVDTTSGFPNDPNGLISSTGGQPIAVYASLILTRPISEQVEPASSRRAPVRTLEPLDRPPRA